MLNSLRVIFIFLFFSLICGCVYLESYPKEWPKALDAEKNECINISGRYANMDSENGVSLAGVLIRNWYGDKYYKDLESVRIIQSNESIVVSINGQYHSNEKRILVFDKDIFCKNEKITFSQGSFEAENVVMGYQNNTFTFQISEDGSLILHCQSSGIRNLALIPMVGTQGRYHLFKKK